ncbi:NRDE protein-domain-containing protein [Rhodocollybia butyracea]|uniref:NRDE protein-domain-containing protein n=1 Tax=Rhodocollybia butyracea TaxID=206335 RepID=A0A9P5U433_9AGAR|nr:NRDE protein-domain-containing protein [Rhodocollybia butyracea]
MCIVFWTLDHPDYSLIVCSNRDEYLNRPTRSATFHSFGHEASPNSILSGIDEVGGGTWFGMTRSGKVALLTNITEPVSKFTSSRGSLVSSFLLSDLHTGNSLQQHVEKLYPWDAKYAGFNLLLLAPAPSASSANELPYDASFVSNAGAGGAISSRPLSDIEKAGGGFSNGVDGKGGSEWPKVTHGLQDFRAALKSQSLTEAEFTNRLFEVLAWKSPTPVTMRSELRNTIEVTPLPITVENNPTLYGTRLSTVILIRRDGHVSFIERDIWKDMNGKIERIPVSSERRFCFKLDSVT